MSKKITGGKKSSQEKVKLRKSKTQKLIGSIEEAGSRSVTEPSHKSPTPVFSKTASPSHSQVKGSFSEMSNSRPSEPARSSAALSNKTSAPVGDGAPERDPTSHVSKKTQKTAAPVPDFVYSSEKREFFSQSSLLLIAAAGVGVLMALASLLMPDGKIAIDAMSGSLTDVSGPAIAMRSAQWALLLDTLFPIFFGAGLILFVGALRGRGNAVFVRLAIAALFIAVVADFSENALAYNAITSGELSAMQWPLTFVKYGLIAFSGIIFSTLFNRSVVFGQSLSFLLRFVFPVLVAALLSGIGGETLRIIVGVSFVLLLVLLAVYATKLAEARL